MPQVSRSCTSCIAKAGIVQKKKKSEYPSPTPLIPQAAQDLVMNKFEGRAKGLPGGGNAMALFLVIRLWSGLASLPFTHHFPFFLRDEATAHSQPVKPGRVCGESPVWVQVKRILQETKRSKYLRDVLFSMTFYSYISQY